MSQLLGPGVSYSAGTRAWRFLTFLKIGNNPQMFLHKAFNTWAHPIFVLFHPIFFSNFQRVSSYGVLNSGGLQRYNVGDGSNIAGKSLKVSETERKMMHRPIFFRLGSLRCACCCNTFVFGCTAHEEKHFPSNLLNVRPLWAANLQRLNCLKCPRVSVSTPDTQPRVKSSSEKLIISPLEVG